MKTLKIILVLFVSFTFAGVQAQDMFKHDRLTKLWETKEGLKTPESVLYDQTNKIIYVSNINENPWSKDGNGFISKLSPNGDIITLEWVKGLNAPKGMGISKGKLYVTDIDEVVEINIAKAEIEKRYGNPKAKNLNDITVGDDGTVYVSDSKGTCFFYLKNGQLDVLSESEDVKAINGCFFEKGNLLLGQSNRLVSFNLKSHEIKVLADSTGYIDGLEAVGDGSYVISDWKGRVHIVTPGKPILLILDSTSKKINAADIEFNPQSKILFVPTFTDNHVVAYKLK